MGTLGKSSLRISAWELLLGILSLGIFQLGIFGDIFRELQLGELWGTSAGEAEGEPPSALGEPGSQGYVAAAIRIE